MAIEKNENKTNAKLIAYVGCRTSWQRNARGKGINVYRVDPVTGEWIHVQLVQGLVNPSFLALDATQRFLYTVHGDCSEVSAFRIDQETGELTFLNYQSTGGKNPVHLVIDPTNRFLIVANYISGTLSVLPVHSDGSLGEIRHLVPLPHAPQFNATHLYEKQGISHPHHTVFDPTGRFLVVPDLGLNRIILFTLNAETGELTSRHLPFGTTQEGAGPRHISFHPVLPYAYVVNELDSTVTVYAFEKENGRLTMKQTIPTVPSHVNGNTAAEIAVSPCGRFVYASNRGHNSIAIFAVDQQTGELSPIGWESTKGATPRFFTFDPFGTFLYVANEDSDTIVAFKVDGKTGELQPTGWILETESPVCIVFSSLR
ncbi:lactonase family protein [Geobacillus zalihae]|uniref:lactonase family protein n=1 Tax=Geobacillus zalihae TaxID=213419 RepID=UPI00261FEB43|nr:lactonase family protein [Geobacillus zalihae]WKA48414.1 lactonase family protein [Geobacillus zalihae]